MRNKKFKIISQAWHVNSSNENDPSMVIYYHDTKEWRVLGQTLHDLTGNIKPSKKGVMYAYKYYISNRLKPKQK